jgi:predicted transcriptional regulator
VDLTDLKTWTNALTIFRDAPHVVFPLLGLAAWVGWWFRGTLTTSQIASLKATNLLLEERRKLTEDRQKQVAEAAEKTVATLQAQVSTGSSGQDDLAGAARSAATALRDIADELSKHAKRLLTKAAADKSGQILKVRMMAGSLIKAGEIVFGNTADHREIARWENAVEELESQGLIVAKGNKREVFEVTDKGYRRADELKVESS